MSASTSDHDMSDTSNTGSPQSYWDPRNSPLQQVPQLARDLTDLSFIDNKFHNGNEPYLRITEQPQNHFRFRYVSEMVGTHGCLLGKSSMSTSSKPKTHPTVELMNYSGQALIRCQLAQHRNPDQHPHRLLEEERERDLSYMVPEQGCYRVAFAGMGIIHTAKKDVPGLLIRQFNEKHGNSNLNAREIKAHCESIAKNIDLNIVRLKFSAHDIETGKEICAPVFSEPIHNMKSASTNDLKICRISRCAGRPKGGDDVFILVEKVNKKNIQIWFYELDENGKRVWSAQAKFIQSDVHHQYAIVFGTPAYRSQEITEDVKVYIELVRPSDGRCSEPKDFTYKADYIYKSSKKRKTTSSYSSLDSSSGGSIRSLSDLPATVFTQNAVDTPNQLQMSMQQFTVNGSTSPNQCELGSALMDTDNVVKISPQTSPMWCPLYSVVPQADQIPNLQLESTELENLLNAANNDDKQIVLENNDLLKEYMTSLPSVDMMDETSSMEFIRSLRLVVSDSGRGRDHQGKCAASTSQSPPVAKANTHQETVDKSKESGEYNAYYKTEDGEEVKKLVKELCEAIRNKHGYKKMDVRNKLERLFDLRLSNGDTFLHMTLCSNLPSFDYIVKLIHSVKMTHLFNYYNDKQQTILHLAVLNDMPKIVTLLVAKGVSWPSTTSASIHFCIVYLFSHSFIMHSCYMAEPPEHSFPYLHPDTLFQTNSLSYFERETPLHLAAKDGWSVGARALLSHGASFSVRDLQGRTPLHIAACELDAKLVEALVNFIPSSDIDSTDDSGNTALQIVCSRPANNNSVEIVKMLLDKKADPRKHEVHNVPALQLARNKPDLLELMKEHIPSHNFEDDVKSEPEDEFESADEYEEMESASVGLGDMRSWAREVCALLDARGAWRALAARANLHALVAWFDAQPSPTLTLLNHLKECRDEITPKSLVMILDDIGEKDAAGIIRKHIE
ncbi:hypothetical protein K1T71_005679 [Dendrolimus kikuchii]|uniref:Uncharacterized protein n=1 Tax=Dendrolimus kikuchii TaxID=765133 RepID=A0ACC1D4P7_9NEOP|nr:hypothetical protein K1T71_005679 [Dendrolimus kikuchii]